jgi:ketosteroid isomerase-like protein
VSQENVEIVRQLYANLDRDDMAAVLAVVATDAQWAAREDSPDVTVVRGHEGFAGLWAEITGVLEEFHIEPTQLTDAGEYVIAEVSQTARTRAAVVEQHEVHVLTLRDGKVIAVREFHEKAEALKAVGLEEQAVSEESTTPDLVEVRSAVEGTYGEYAAFAERYYAADAVLDSGDGAPLGPAEGLASILAVQREYWEMWATHHHYVDDIVDLGRGVWYLVVREDGRIKGSEVPVEASHAWILLWDRGAVVRILSYLDIGEGRAAAERLAEERG